MAKAVLVVMATYEFKCCGVTQEITVSIKEQLPKPKCAVCNGDMQRVYSPFGVSFKGSGYYSTDNRR
jgi:putative FmdB family regulatory protein